MQSPTMPYNQQALRVLELAREEARTFNHYYIGTEHLLLGILGEGSAAIELINQDLTVERVRGGILFVTGRLPSQPGYTPQTDHTPRAKQVLALAGEEAQRLGETAISPYHLLVAILREGQGIAAQLLLVSGVRLEQTGDTARISLVSDEEGSITLPPDLQQALRHHPVAYRLFEKLPYTKQKKFVDHIEQAVGEAARSQQVAETIEQLHQIYQIHQRLQ